MKKKFLDLLACRNTSEVARILSDCYVQFRAWLQKNGELSFVLGIVAGTAFILFFKIVVLFLALLVILAALWWFWLEQRSSGN